MVLPADVAEAFARLQQGDAPAALAAANRAAQAQPGNARAHLAAGIALRLLGRLAEAQGALDRAARLDPSDYAAPYEAALVRQAQGDPAGALRGFEEATRLKPGFFAAHYSAGLLQFAARDWGAAEASFGRALAIEPRNALALRTFGQHCVARGDFDRAAELFAAAAREEPSDQELPMFLAQVELLRGHWADAWRAYARREPRQQHERALAARGQAYAPQPFGVRVERDVVLAGEQGLGDLLFFLRFAPLLRRRGARLHFAGEPRLHSLLSRTGLFESLVPRDRAPADAILVGDLPALLGEADVFQPSLAIAPDPARVQRWRKVLEGTGPHPWIGLTWRAGTPPAEVSYALHKSVPPQQLLQVVARAGGTLISLQRRSGAGEIARLGESAAVVLHDLGAALEDLEDALALVSLLDRHVGVSNTNMHLGAAAGCGGDVLVPFPPEWRWRISADSPWFPGFRVHRQAVDGSWDAALRSLAGA